MLTLGKWVICRILPRVQSQPRDTLEKDRPMTLDDSILAMRLRVMHRAQALGNVSAVCREAGLSRTRFYCQG